MGQILRAPEPLGDRRSADWLVTAKGRRESRKFRAFRDWLKVEVPASVRGYVYQSRG